MRCPVCGFEDQTPSEFCASCGAPLPHAAPAGPPVTPGGVAQAPAPAPAPQAPAYAAPVAADPEVVEEVQVRRFQSVLGAIIIGVLALLIVGGGVAVYLLTRDKDPEVKPKAETSERNKGQKLDINTERGFGTALEALEDAGGQYYGEDAEWWYYPLVEEEDIAEYWVGPTDGDWQRGVIVEVRNDEWFVTDTYTVDPKDVQPEDPETTDATPEEAAAWTVDEFFAAMYEGRYEDMMALTAAPLNEYTPEEFVEIFTPADMAGFEITGAEAYDDGTAIVAFTIEYSDGSYYEIGALCELGDDGYYYITGIGELEGEEGETP